MVSHMALTHRHTVSEDSHSWPALRDRAGPWGLWSGFCLPKTADSHLCPRLLRRAAPGAASLWQLRVSLSPVLQACGSHRESGSSSESQTLSQQPQGGIAVPELPNQRLLPLFPHTPTLKTARQAKRLAGRYRGCY